MQRAGSQLKIFSLPINLSNDLGHNTPDNYLPKSMVGPLTNAIIKINSACLSTISYFNRISSWRSTVLIQGQICQCIVFFSFVVKGSLLVKSCDESQIVTIPERKNL